MRAKLVLVKASAPQEAREDAKKIYQDRLVEAYQNIMPIRYAKSTLPNYKSAMSNFLPWIEERDLYVWELSPSHFDEFSQHLKANVKNSTIVNYLTHISNFYNWMISRHGPEIQNLFAVKIINPIDDWNTPKRRSEEDELPELPDADVVHYYFQREKAELAKAINGQDARAIPILARQITAEQIMLQAGLRVQEVANLDVNDINLENMILIVRRGKNDKDRIVDISEPLARVLKWYLEQGHPTKERGKSLKSDTPLFLSERKQRISTVTLQSRTWFQQEYFNVPIDRRFSPHGLRRLFATNLYMELVQENNPDPLTYVKGQLGHVFYSTTLRYCRIPQAIIARARTMATQVIAEKLGSAEEGECVDDN